MDFNNHLTKEKRMDKHYFAFYTCAKHDPADSFEQAVAKLLLFFSLLSSLEKRLQNLMSSRVSINSFSHVPFIVKEKF